MRLQGQRVVVLGGTSGLGLAAANAAAAHGAEVTVVSSRQSSVDRALAVLPKGTVGRAVDLTEPSLIRGLFGDLGEIDHLVFTAGEPLPLMTMDALDLDKAKDLFTLRFFGALTAAQVAVPHLRQGGSITLTTGTGKDRPGPGWAVVASVLGAIDALTRALAVELAPIRVNAVSPGVVRSPMWEPMMSAADLEAMYGGIAATILAKRVGEVDDVADAYLYLLTQPFTTGTVLTVDGGTILV